MHLEKINFLSHHHFQSLDLMKIFLIFLLQILLIFINFRTINFRHYKLINKFNFQRRNLTFFTQHSITSFSIGYILNSIHSISKNSSWSKSCFFFKLLKLLIKIKHFFEVSIIFIKIIIKRIYSQISPTKEYLILNNK